MLNEVRKLLGDGLERTERRGEVSTSEPERRMRGRARDRVRAKQAGRGVTRTGGRLRIGTAVPRA